MWPLYSIQVRMDEKVPTSPYCDTLVTLMTKNENPKLLDRDFSIKNDLICKFILEVMTSWPAFLNNLTLISVGSVKDYCKALHTIPCTL